MRHKPRLFSVKRRPYSDTLRHAASRCRQKKASGSMFRNISSPVKFKREAPPQMSSAPRSQRDESCVRGDGAQRKCPGTLLPARKCGRNAIMIAASRQCRPVTLSGNKKKEDDNALSLSVYV